MPDTVNIEVAGVNFAVSCRNAVMLPDFDSAYIPFLKSDRDSLAVNVDVDLELNGIPDTSGLKKLFDSDQSWAIFSEGRDYWLVLRPRSFGAKAIWAARFDCDLSRITVHCGELLIRPREDGHSVSNPVRYPLDQIVLMYVLAKRGGGILHAAGININNAGYVFPGRSGAGKSTLSRQFEGRGNSEILSDDRIIVRKIGDAFEAFGTPWPGEAGFAVNKGVPLAGMFFLSHGSENRIRGIGEKEALERLLPIVSIPWYDAEVMKEVLDFCGDIISNVPVYELSFKPGFDVVRILEEFASLEKV